jgi:hypothetical protein
LIDRYGRITAAMTDDNAVQGSPSESEHKTEHVALELTQSQIDRVIRDATGAGKISILLSGLTGVQETLRREPGLMDDPRISTSLMRGLLVIAALPRDGDYVRLSDIAELLGIGLSTAHRYVTTLLVVGLVERDPASRRYRLAK